MSWNSGKRETQNQSTKVLLWLNFILRIDWTHISSKLQEFIWGAKRSPSNKYGLFCICNVTLHFIRFSFEVVSCQLNGGNFWKKIHYKFAFQTLTLHLPSHFYHKHHSNLGFSTMDKPFKKIIFACDFHHPWITDPLLSHAALGALRMLVRGNPIFYFIQLKVPSSWWSNSQDWLSFIQSKPS